MKKPRPKPAGNFQSPAKQKIPYWRKISTPESGQLRSCAVARFCYAKISHKHWENCGEDYRTYEKLES